MKKINLSLAKKIDKLNNRYIYMFLISILLNILISLVLGLYPFGENMHIRSDSSHQYVRFLDFLRRVIYEGNISELMYSFSNGFGHGGILYAAYYLLSPFNILILFFPHLDIEFIFMLIILLKQALIGLSFYYFLEKFEFELNKSKYLFSLSYSFISFVVLYNINIMWLDSIMLLPILFVYLKDMFNTNKITKFTIAMLVLYFSNFYMAFIVCVFIVIILLISLIFKQNIKVDLKRKLGLFILSVMISILMFGAIWLPLMYELIEFYDVSEEYILIEPLSLFKILCKLFPFNFDTFFSMKYMNSMSPYVYFGLLPLLLSFVYLLFGEKNSDKKILIVASLVVVISFLIPEINIMWHGFEAPTGFDYRYSFLLSFLGLIMSCKGYKYLCRNSLNKKEISKLIILVILILAAISKYSNKVMLLVNIVFVLLYLQIICIKSLDTWKYKLTILFVFELILNTIFLNLMLGAQIGTSTKEMYFELKSTSEIKRVVEEYYDSDYRMLIDRELLSSMNIPIEIGYKGTSSFNSSTNFNFISSLSNLGLYRTGQLAHALDSNYITDSLLSIKYVISSRELRLYNMLDEITIFGKKAYVYENPYVLPVGFVTPKDMAKLKDFKVEENMLSLMSSISGKDYDVNDLYKKYLPKKVSIDGIEVNKNKDGDYIINKNMVDETSVLKVEYDKPQNLAVRVGTGVEYKADELILTKANEDGMSYRNSFRYYNNLDKGSSVLELKTYLHEWNNSSCERINLGKLEGLELNEFYAKKILQDINTVNKPYIEHWDGNSVKLIIDSKNKNEILFTNIPYASSWKAKVNGKETNLDSTVINTLSINLENGKNIIELEYVPKGLKTGAFISSVGILILVIRIKKFE